MKLSPLLLALALVSLSPSVALAKNKQGKSQGKSQGKQQKPDAPEQEHTEITEQQAKELARCMDKCQGPSVQCMQKCGSDTSCNSRCGEQFSQCLAKACKGVLPE